ncbi:MAG: threonylcarbamoyl-AMP synthase [Oscillospiraceae bacterium]|nr:threonylcarbamoyl-AMP synthase [Oscillospiraceae bacterium]MDE7171763.1 threonylcarbamoyl-AMP synthase [Oscillospiraceae bacterium]
MYTHVIFDLDGTLLNTIDDLTAAGNHVCAAHGWPTYAPDQFKRMVGSGIPTLVRRFAPDGLSDEEVAGALAEFSAYYNDHKADKTAPYPGVPAMLAALKGAGIHMAVLSNKAHTFAGPVVEGYFPGVFEYVQGALPDAPLKPDPTLLRALMERIGAKPETTLFVGDSDVDVLTGKNGGLTVCGVLWGFRDRPELESVGADQLIDSPEQLAAVVTGTALLAAGQAAQAASLLRQGKLVAVPTETVYGLAADATQEKAVQTDYDAKGRPETKPLNVLVDGMAMVETVCRDIPEDAYKLADAFWPGPLTMILCGNGSLPPIVPAGGATQGVRCPDHPDTLAVIRALGKPLACPSANLSGRESPKSAGAVLAQLGGRIDAILDGGPCTVGMESTILDLTVTPYRILRQGGLSREAIEAALGREVEA